MTRCRVLVLLTGVAAVTLAVPWAGGHAEELPPDSGGSRFALYSNGEGYLRLDTRTGEVAACNHREAFWTCVLVPDERAALDVEIARLQRENAALKGALLSKNIPLPDAMATAETATPPSVDPSRPTPPLPVPPNVSGKSSDAERLAREDADIDRMLNVMSKVWRRLVEMMMSLQRDPPKNGATPL